MRTVTIDPYTCGEQGSFGRVLIDHEHYCYSAEPPWKNNQPNHSCIPPGEYRCTWHRSPRYGWVYLVTDVEQRAWILIHPGNVAGDRTKGYATHSYGCILLGRKLGFLNYNKQMQRAVLISRPTVRKFFEEMGQKDFQLIIRERRM